MFLCNPLFALLLKKTSQSPNTRLVHTLVQFLIQNTFLYVNTKFEKRKQEACAYTHNNINIKSGGTCYFLYLHSTKLASGTPTTKGYKLYRQSCIIDRRLSPTILPTNYWPGTAIRQDLTLVDSDAQETFLHCNKFRQLLQKAV